MRNHTKPSQWLALIVILAAPLLYVIDIFIINMAIPAIQSDLDASDSEIQLVIAAYLLGSAVFLIAAGRAGDYLGKKKVFFWGMFFFTITSCICGLCQTAVQLDIARFLQGISSAFMVTQSIALIQVLFPGAKERARAIGWYGITLSIAAIIGQILGGYLAGTQYGIEGWRLIFFINVPVGVIALRAIQKLLPETEQVTGFRFDYTGTGLFISGLGSLIYAVTEGREQAWPLWSVVLLCVALLLLGIFIRDQQLKLNRKKGLLIDIRLFRHKVFNIGLLAVLFHFMLHTAYLLMIAVFLQNGMGISALQCGMYFIPHALLFMLSSVVASRLLLRYGKKVLQAGLLIILISFVLQMLYLGTADNASLSILLLGIYGLGNGLVLPFLLNIVLNNIHSDNAGMASGIFSTFQQTASALGISLIGGLFYTALDGRNTPAGYLHALRCGLALNLVCLLIVVFMLYRIPDMLKDQPFELRPEQ